LQTRGPGKPAVQFKDLKETKAGKVQCITSSSQAENEYNLPLPFLSYSDFQPWCHGCQAHLFVYTLINFHKYMRLCNHHPVKMWNISIILVPFWPGPAFPIPHYFTDNHCFDFCYVILRESHSMFSFISGFFHQYKISEIHPCFSMYE
jgi:hypothetical protein